MRITRRREQQPSPFPRASAPSSAPPAWATVDGYSTRPGYGLTVDRVLAAYRSAEAGSLAAQCDLFEDVLENDGHARGQYLARLNAVANATLLVQPGGDDALSMEAAAKLGEALADANTDALVWNTLDAIFFGPMATHVRWAVTEGAPWVRPVWFWGVPGRRLVVDHDDVIRLAVEGNTTPGQDMPGGEYVVAAPPHRKAARSGLMRTATWWMLFKRLSVRDWMIFAEKFGIPFVLGYWSERGASDASRKALEQAVQEIGEDGCAVLSDATKLQIEQSSRTGDVSALHPSVVAMCNAEVSKLFTGATLVTESGGNGSYAQASVHESRALGLTEGDALWLARVLDRQLVAPFMAFNGLYGRAARPRLKVITRPAMDPAMSVKVDQTLHAMGLPLDTDQLYETYGRRRPSARTALAPPAKPAPSDKADPSDEPDKPTEETDQ